jgi:hypothetical protein
MAGTLGGGILRRWLLLGDHTGLAVPPGHSDRLTDDALTALVNHLDENVV